MKVCRAGGLGFPEVPVPAVAQTGTQRTGPGPGRRTGTIDDANATAAGAAQHPLLSGLPGQVAADQRLSEWFSGGLGVRHPLAHLAEGPWAVAGAVAAALVEAHTGVQQYGQGAPAGGVPPLGCREGGADVDQWFGAAWTDPVVVVVAGVGLLVRGPAGQADVRGPSVHHAGRVEPPQGRARRIYGRLRGLFSTGGAAHALRLPGPPPDERKPFWPGPSLCPRDRIRTCDSIRDTRLRSSFGCQGSSRRLPVHRPKKRDRSAGVRDTLPR